MKNCPLIQDLLPLYADGLVSQESQEEIEAHIKTCKECSLILERMKQKEESPQKEHQEFKNILHSLNRKRRIKIFVSATLLLFILAGFFVLWSKGMFHIIERQKSPDGSTTTTVFDCRLGYGDFPSTGGFTLSDTGKYRGRTIYEDAEFQGLWWSSNGNYQVVSMLTEEGIWLSMVDFQRNCGINLDGRLNIALYENDFFADVVYDEETGQRRIEFSFLQWSQKDEPKMLIYFTYEDSSMKFHEGYFWYDYETGETYGEMEIEQENHETNILNNLLQ